MERESNKRRRQEQIRMIALNTVQLAGLLALAVAVPNALSGFKRLGLVPGSRQKESLKRSYTRLIKNGLLRYEGRYVRLTQKGKSELARLLQRSATKPKRWDGKWRVLIFDIPERKKSLRERIRHVIIEIGFVRLQDSVWVYPYDCEDLVTLLKADLRVGFDLLYLIVDRMEGDMHVKQMFGLP